MKIALTGSIACGKTCFCRILQSFGMRILNADTCVHELEAPDGQAAPAILARFGTLERASLARLVFGPGCEKARKDLENIVFPLVRTRLNAFIKSVEETETRIVEIPLLFESHFDKEYDIIIVLSSPEELQIRRLAETRGMSRVEAEARINAQMPLVEKIARGSFVVYNDSTPGHLYDEAKRLCSWLKERGAYHERD